MWSGGGGADVKTGCGVGNSRNEYETFVGSDDDGRNYKWESEASACKTMQRHSEKDEIELTCLEKNAEEKRNTKDNIY